jgi:hypothetical protein
VDKHEELRNRTRATPEQAAKAREVVVDGSYAFRLNMNDTFGFACADGEEMDDYDFELLMPIIAKYGRHALVAYVSVKRKAEPMHCPCGHDGHEYKSARAEIEALKRDFPENFMVDS